MFATPCKLDNMNTEEYQYLDLLKELLHSPKKEDRTGVGTYSKFGHQMRFSLKDGKLPLLTTKKVFFRGVVEELLFFIRGDRDTTKLEERGIKIWSGNTTREFLDSRGLSHYEVGDMGPMYGVQWRNFGGNRTLKDSSLKRGVDQLQNAFDLIKNNPNSRRILVTAYNPDETNLGVLDPCHTFFQFNVHNEYLDCLFYMRSWDVALGGPFNIASYAVLTHVMAKATGLKPRELIVSSGDTHLYETHIKGVTEQILRDPYPFPTLKINKDISSLRGIENLKYEDFELLNYKYHPPIKMEMAV